MNKRLLFTSIGDNTDSYKYWNTPNKQYDIIFVYYGKSQEKHNELSTFCDRIFWNSATKFQNFVKYFQYFIKYEYICITDDDIELSPEKIERLFSLCKNNNIYVASPSHSPQGKISHSIMKTVPNILGRKVTFVEVTCPILHISMASILVDYLKNDVYHLKEWGIDYIMQNIFRKRVNGFYIFDCLPIINPHDYNKLTQKREIDSTSSNRQRYLLWKKFSKSRNLKEYPHKILQFLKNENEFS